MNIEDLIERGEKLPTIAHVAQRVIDSLNSEEPSVAEIGTLISADPVLSAQLLRLANSAYFKMERGIETIDGAMRVLGLAMVRNLVLGSCFKGAFAKTPGLDLPLFWTHSLYTASTAHWLADQLHASQDLAFTLGLMHGIGQLQMHMAAPSAMAAIDQECPPLAAERAALENAAFGFCYLDVSAALARLWNFPASLSEPMSRFATPWPRLSCQCPPAWCIWVPRWPVWNCNPKPWRQTGTRLRYQYGSVWAKRRPNCRRLQTCATAWRPPFPAPRHGGRSVLRKMCLQSNP